jgi:Tfp pilus assembly protein PilF
MRKRSLLAVVLVTFALPALAGPPKANPDTLTAIADLQADFAFDVFATPSTKAELIDSARENYRKALQIDPKHKDALRGLARLHARTGKRDKAVEAYKNYLRHYPNDADATRELAAVAPQPLPFARNVGVNALGCEVRAHERSSRGGR